jgi:hypothetical protein
MNLFSNSSKIFEAHGVGMAIELSICATLPHKFGQISFDYSVGQIASDPLSRWHSIIERME